jgi:class 3 adenylate cyclase
MARQRISGQQAFRNFQESFQKSFRKAGPLTQDTLVAEGRMLAGTAAVLGHPEYLHLKPGQTRAAKAVVGFVDIRGITKLSFALEDVELLRVIQSLTEASIRAIHDGGGYIGEFTGDGVMAYFGDSSTTDEEATLSALETLSLLFKSVNEIVNPELIRDGLDPIQIAAGMEFGDVLWSRVGLDEVSQLKPIGTPTFFAGKLSSGKYTGAWECKIGEKLAAWIPDEYKKKVKQYGPVSVKKQEFTRELYLFDWQQFARDTLFEKAKLEEQMRKRFAATASGAGTVLSSSRVVTPSSQPAPRPLKDQPFF